MKLNEDQKIAHDALVEFVLNKQHKHSMMLLGGYAGTGKTVTITEVINTLQNFEQKSFAIAMSAPTHKAVKVLKKFATPGNGVDYATIHSLLGLQETEPDAKGKITFKRKWQEEGDSRIADYSVVIVDEASMLNDEILLGDKDSEGLFGYKSRIKIIFVG